MGKAFSDEEKELIKEKIKKESFELFKIYGIRKTSIASITKKVGIAQGGFYTFYKSKEEIFYDIIDNDMDIQIEHCLNCLEKNTCNPKEVLKIAIKHYCFHMQENRAVWIDEPDVMEILRNRNKEYILREKQKLAKAIETMKDYWIKNKYIESMNVKKLVSVFIMARIMYINKECCDEADFEEIFKIFISSEIEKYLKI